MADPVSWFVVEPGWDVVDADGESIGRIQQVIGDTEADIFNGLAVSGGVLSGDRYVPAERVGEITDGTVQLAMGRAEFEQLDPYEQPPPSHHIIPPDRLR